MTDHAPTVPLKILFAETSDSASDLIRRSLLKSDMPCIITRCESGEAALGALRQQRRANDCHLVLIDQDLPDMSGQELCARILAAVPDMPVILLVAPGEETEAAGALKAGAADCVVMDDHQGFTVLLPAKVASAAARRGAWKPAPTSPATCVPEEQEDFFRLLSTSHSPIMLQTIDAEGTLVSVSDSWLDRLGYAREEVLGRPATDFLTPESRRYAEEVALPSLRETGLAMNVPYQYATKDGTPLEVVMSATTTRDDTGAFVRGMAVLLDVTDHKQAEQRLRTSEQRYQALRTQTSDGLFIVDRQGNFLSANPRFCAMLDYTEAELRERNIADLLSPEDSAAAQALLADAPGGETTVSEHRLLGKHSAPVLVEAQATLLEDGRVQAIVREVGDRTQTAPDPAPSDALPAPSVAGPVPSDALLGATLDATADGVLVVDANGQFLTYNQKLVEMWGLPEAILAARDGDQALQFVLDQLTEPEAFRAKVQELYGDPHAESIDILEFKDGRIIEHHSHPLRVEGEPSGRVWSFRDVTETRSALTNLEATEARLRTVMASLPLVLFTADARGVCTFAEGQALRSIGLKPEDIVGTTVLPDSTAAPQFTRIGEAPEIVDHMRRALAGEEVTAKFPFAGRLFDVRYSPVRGSTGEVEGIMGVATDVQDHAQAEEDRRRAEEQLGSLVANAPVVLFGIDRDGIFTLSEGKGLASQGLWPGEIVGQSVYELYRDVPQILENVRQALAGTPVSALTEIGDLVYEVHYTPLRDADGTVTGVSGVATDYTDRATAQRALQASEERYRVLADQARDVIWAADAQGLFTYVSPSAERLFGFPPDELIGYHFLSSVVAADQEHVDPEVRAWIDADDLGAVLPDNWLVEIRQATSTGEAIWCEVSVTAVRDAGGRLVAIQGVSRDITERRLSEAALRTSEERFRVLTEHAQDLIWSIDVEGRFTYLSPSVERFLGLNTTEMLGHHFAELLAPEALEMTNRLFAEGMAGTRTEARFEARLVPRSGEPIWYELYAVFLVDDAGRPMAVQGVARDITERRQADAALRESEERHRHLATQVRDIIWSIDSSGRFTYCSPSLERITGFTPEEVMGRGLDAIMHPDYLEQGMQLFGQAASGELDELMFESALRRKDGSVCPCEVNCVVLRDANGQLVGINGVTRDITERREAEQALRASEERYRALADHAQDMIWIADAEGHFTYVSPAIERITGFRPEEVLGYHYLTGLVTEEANVSISDLTRQVEAGELDAYRIEVPILNRAGEKVWCEIAVTVLRDADGRIRLRQGAARDITERKQAEEALRRSEASLAQAQQLAQMGNWAWDIPTDTLTWSDEIYRIFGIGREEFAGTYDSFMSFVHGDDREAVEAAIQASLSQGTPYGIDHRVRRPDGTLRWVHEHGEVVYDKDGTPIGGMGTVQDITERKRAEEALQFTQFAVDHAADAVFWMDPDARFTYVNDAACRSLGLSREELLTLSVFDIDADFTREQWPVVWDSLTRDGVFRLETRHRRKDGTTFPVEITANLLQYGDKRFNCAFARDISERQQAEAERHELQQQIQHTQKLESLGVLAGGIAHDFNNLLVGMLGNAGLALMDLPDSSPSVGYLQRIETAAQRAADLTNQLLAYSGRGKFIIRPLHLSALVEEMAHLLETVISKKAVLKLNLATDLPAIEGDATQVRQVIMNLITNASDAVENKSGAISITTGRLHADRAYLTETFLDEDLAEGIYAYLEVSDSGIGMDVDTIAKIFDPFFTTKFTGRGLGLAAVLGIVRGHHGALKVYSEPGRGSTFKVLFPAVNKEVLPAPEEPPSAREWRSGGLVLVVDDEENVRSVAKATLEHAGFEILTANDGVEALEVFKEHEEDIVLVLLDMTMPHMAGDETFRELRRLRSEVCVILSSGFNEQDATNEFSGKGLAGFIQKPYHPSALLDKVRAALEG